MARACERVNSSCVKLNAPAERDLERGAWVRRHDLGILHLVPRDLRRGRLVEVRCSRGTAELLLAQRRALSSHEEGIDAAAARKVTGEDSRTR